MEIELWSGSTKAIVDPMGAWLTNLSDEDGDVLFPKRALKAVDGTTKHRGGSCVCLPNFGSGGASGLPQHGFARDQAWEVLDKTENGALLKLAPTEGEYKNMTAVLAYQLGDNLLRMTLDLVNDSDLDMRVAPAFHPYFATLEEPVKINGEVQKLSELDEAEFINGTAWELEAAGRVVTLKSQDLTTWAKWTDQLGPYVCLEPTLAGFSFEKDAALDIEVLAPGKTKTYSFTMSWRRV